MEEEYMTDKQYDGVLKDAIHAIDRIAKTVTDKEILKTIYEERNNFVEKLGYPVNEHNLYDAL